MGQAITKIESTRREKFCREYVLNLGNGTQAYIEAYSTPKKQVQENTAGTNSWRLLRNAEIQARIREIKIELHDVLMGSYEETLQEISSLAMFDPAGMFDEDGRLLTLDKMDPATRKMVHEIEIILGDDDRPLRIAKLKYGKDKRAYLDMMMKHLNGYNEHQKAGAGQVNIALFNQTDAML